MTKIVKDTTFNTMNNPWSEFLDNPKQDYLILNDDRIVVDCFNENAKEEYRIHTEIMPAPFMGNVLDSPVLLLLLNPGFDEEEERKGYYKLFRDYWEKEIQHEHPVPDLPLFCLEDKYTQFSDYWKRRLRFLIEATSKEKVAQNVALVQFFPYHTKKYKTIPKRISTDYLASQQYNFHLVEKAIEREATIIMLRGKEQWCESVPLLTEYKNLSFTNSYLNTYLSKGNLKNFDEIVDKINAHIIAK